jgi:hypothetical protein
MSLNKEQLEALNNSVFPNNNTGEITPADLRLFNSSSIDAFALETELTSVSASFAATITGSLEGTASWSIIAVTASYFSGSITNSETASYIPVADGGTF